MSTLMDDFRGSLATMFGHGVFGVPALFTPVAGGPTTSIQAIVHEGDSLAPDAVGTNPAATATIRVLETQVPDPAIDDTITVASSGDAWRIVRIASRSAGVFVLDCIRDGRVALK